MKLGYRVHILLILSLWLANVTNAAADGPAFGAVMPIDVRGALIGADANGVVLAADALGIQAADLPALLRFRVPDRQPAPPWAIVIKSSKAQTAITSENITNLGLSESGFQLLIDDLCDIHISFSSPAPDLIYDAVIKINAGQRPQYIISQNLQLYYAKKDLSGQLQRLAISRAIVKLEFDIPQGHTQCTGFQISPGAYLTNRHCVDPALRNNRSLVTKVTFGIDDQHPYGQTSVAADLVKMGAFLPGQQQGGLDYGLLRSKDVPPDFRDASINLQDRSMANSDRPLELYQIWSGLGGSGPGNALSMNPECVAGKSSQSPPRALNNPSCPAPDFLHGCDSEGGSSGSPIFLRGTRTIVGIHWGGISPFVGNCAVSITNVVGDLGPL